MFEIVYNVEVIHAKINKTFAELGIPLKSEDMVAVDMLCVSIVTEYDDLNKVQVILNQADIETSVIQVPIELDWLPCIYYINVPKNKVRNSISLLEHVTFQNIDISKYLGKLAASRLRFEKFFVWLGVLFIVSTIIMFICITLGSIEANRLDAVVLFGLLTIGYMMLGLLFIKEITKRKKK